MLPLCKSKFIPCWVINQPIDLTLVEVGWWSGSIIIIIWSQQQHKLWVMQLCNEMVIDYIITTIRLHHQTPLPVFNNQ